jgi:glycosyltransferase involved in cell wall biosynthesis
MLLTTEKPVIINKPEYKFETVLFLPSNPERKAEGGLRTKGLFKHSYKKGEDGIWYMCDTEGNPVKPALDEVQKKVQEYLSKFDSTGDIKELPLITVITVVLNGEKYLEQTIQSVINQTYPNVEYIIIDGGSTNRTLDIIRKYEDYIDYWVSEPDKGIYDAMNKGIRCSLGKGLMFLNAGDYFVGEVLSPLLQIPSFIPVKYPIFGLNKLVKAKVRNYKQGLPYCHQGIIFENKKLLYDTTLKYCADYDFYLRHGYKYLPLSKVKGYVYYDNKGYSSKNYIERDREIYEYIRKKFGITYSLIFLIRTKFKHFIKSFISDKFRLW